MTCHQIIITYYEVFHSWSVSFMTGQLAEWPVMEWFCLDFDLCQAVIILSASRKKEFLKRVFMTFPLCLQLWRSKYTTLTEN